MKIGITFDLRPPPPPAQGAGELDLPSAHAVPRSATHRVAGGSDGAVLEGETGLGPAAAGPSTARGRLTSFAVRLQQAQDAWEEFDSAHTIAALAQVFQDMGHDVLLLGDGPHLLEALCRGPRPDLVFNLAEGHGSGRTREARVPALLELLGIPYTGSDALTLAATLDKDCAKRLVASLGVPTPAWVLLRDGDVHAVQHQLDRLPRPWFVKPAYEGSSKGIFSLSVVQTRAELADAAARLHETYQQPILVEEFIEGDELTVGVLDDGRPTLLGIMRVLPRVHTPRFIYSLEVKRNYEQLVDYECPARLPLAVRERVEAAALAAWQVLGCRDVARIDFRLRDGVPYFLEANPLPGLTPGSSDLVIMAEKLGLSHAELIRKILSAALRRSGLADDNLARGNGLAVQPDGGPLAQACGEESH